MTKILIVDDDVRLARALEDWLVGEEHHVEHLAEGRAGLKRALEGDFEVLILDWNLPGLEGTEICRQYKDSGGVAKVIMLTGKGAVRDRVAGLDAGADDYLTKPFSPEELSARLRALTRRTAADTKSSNAAIIECGYLKLDSKAKVLLKDDQPVKLNAKEMSLVEFFMRNPNEVFSSNDLLDRVWSQESEVSTDTIRVYITRIRDRIDRDKENSVIKTLHSLGYKFVPPES
ncbi:MAG TPA: response regulator transcription factor [Planktothrix sp.]